MNIHLVIKLFLKSSLAPHPPHDDVMIALLKLRNFYLWLYSVWKNLSETLENYWGYPLVSVTTTFILSLHFEFQFIYYEVKVRERI